MKKYGIWKTRWGLKSMFEGWVCCHGDPALFDSELCAVEYLHQLEQKNYDSNTEFEIRIYGDAA